MKPIIILVLYAVFEMLLSSAYLSTPFLSGTTKTAIKLDQKPFSPPEDPRLAPLFRDYRQSFEPISDLHHSGLHWSQYVRTFINQDAETYRNNNHNYLQWLNDDEREPQYRHYKPGTVILKENFMRIEEGQYQPVSVSAMIKHEAGYDPELGNWEYVQFTPQGQLILSGNSKSEAVQTACLSCHRNIAERDFVFHTSTKSPPQRGDQ